MSSCPVPASGGLLLVKALGVTSAQCIYLGHLRHRSQPGQKIVFRMHQFPAWCFLFCFFGRCVCCFLICPQHACDCHDLTRQTQQSVLCSAASCRYCDQMDTSWFTRQQVLHLHPLPGSESVLVVTLLSHGVAFGGSSGGVHSDEDVLGYLVLPQQQVFCSLCSKFLSTYTY